MDRTSLYDLHTRLGAKMVEFAGWEMPVFYSSIMEEHLATRTACTLFDVSHMGRLYLSGSDSGEVLEHLCTRRVGTMKVGQARYSHICREDGGILDDVLVYRLEEQRWLVVCNASNRQKMVDWILRHSSDRAIQVDDATRATAMMAVQGPQTLELAQELLPPEIGDLRRYHFMTGRYMGIEYMCSRTGYTGEDGLEIIVSSAAGRMLANSIFDEHGVVEGRIAPAGLGARDTLRLEAAMPLYGHELHEGVDSISAGQSWCVDLDKDFIGCEALRTIKERGPQRTLSGFEVRGRRITRQGTSLLSGRQAVGVVTSGTMSPTLQKVIGMGYVDTDYSREGTALQADIRGTITDLRIVTLPFYRRSTS